VQQCIDLGKAGQKEWILESVKSAHMAGIGLCSRTSMTLVPASNVAANRLGNVFFNITYGYVTFTCVLHVSELHRTLISVPQLTWYSLSIRTLKDKCIISGNQGHIMTVQKSGPFVYSIMFHKYRPSAKKNWIDMSQGYHGHRKAFLLSHVSRRFFGAECGLLDAKVIACSQMLRQICRESLRPHRTQYHISEI
jgi:hypothetical protein